MGYYQQTLLIPMPAQRLQDARGARGRDRSRPRREVNRNEGINSILAYFDRGPRSI